MPIEETCYHDDELTCGECDCCGEESDEILIGDGRCLDCIELERFMDACDDFCNQNGIDY